MARDGIEIGGRDLFVIADALVEYIFKLREEKLITDDERAMYLKIMTYAVDHDYNIGRRHKNLMKRFSEERENPEHTRRWHPSMVEDEDDDDDKPPAERLQHIPVQPPADKLQWIPVVRGPRPTKPRGVTNPSDSERTWIVSYMVGRGRRHQGGFRSADDAHAWAQKHLSEKQLLTCDYYEYV